MKKKNSSVDKKKVGNHFGNKLMANPNPNPAPTPNPNPNPPRKVFSAFANAQKNTQAPAPQTNPKPKMKQFSAFSNAQKKSPAPAQKTMKQFSAFANAQKKTATQTPGPASGPPFDFSGIQTQAALNDDDLYLPLQIPGRPELDENPENAHLPDHPLNVASYVKEKLKELGYDNEDELQRYRLPSERKKVGLAYHDPAKSQFRLRTYSHFVDERRKTNCRQYICHSQHYNYLLMFPGDNYKGVLMYDMRSQVYIGRPDQTRPTSAPKAWTCASCGSTCGRCGGKCCWWWAATGRSARSTCSSTT